MTCTKNINQSRLLLKALRGGDYAHVGGTTIIDMIVSKISAFNPIIQAGKTLDVGSGLGGTAQYLYEKGFKNIRGIDIDEAAIRYASEKHPGILFKAINALDVDRAFTANHFDLLYLLNVAYAIEDKEGLFKKLAKICVPEGILVIFDFFKSESGGVHLNDLSDQSMKFANLQVLQKILKESGWKILQEDNLSSESIDWYKKDIKTLQSIKNDLLKEFPQSSVLKTENVFSTIVNFLQNQTLSSFVIYAQKETISKI